MTRALRKWSFDHSAEFTLIYGSPVPGYHAPQDTVPAASRTPAVLAGIVRSALAAGELTPPRRTVPGPPLLRPEAVELFGGVPEAPFSDLIERGIVLWSNLIGLLVFQVFSRTHDSVRDESAYFDFAIAVAAEGIGLTVPLEEESPPTRRSAARGPSPSRRSPGCRKSAHRPGRPRPHSAGGGTPPRRPGTAPRRAG